MITEDQIKKVARQELGVEDIDWFLIKYHDQPNLRRIETQCEHCGTTFHKVFDLRENPDERNRVNLGIQGRLKALREETHAL